MREAIEELGRTEKFWNWSATWSADFGPLWDEGLELRSFARGGGKDFRLCQGGREVGRLRIEGDVPRIEAEAAWAELLLREVFEEWLRQSNKAPAFALAA